MGYSLQITQLFRRKIHLICLIEKHPIDKRKLQMHPLINPEEKIQGVLLGENVLDMHQEEETN